MTFEFDFLVVGTGPTSEPAIHHLSKTDFSVCIVDASNLFTSDQEASDLVKKTDMKGEDRTPITKKQNFNLAISPKLNDSRIINTSFYSCNKNNSTKRSKIDFFTAHISGGLSNFWGGGCAEWPVDQIDLLNTFKSKDFYSAYKAISNRIPIKTVEKLLPEMSPMYYKLLGPANSYDEQLDSEFNLYSARYMTSSQEPNDLNSCNFNQSLIWNSRSTIKMHIRKNRNLRYISELRVLHIKRVENAWCVICRENTTGKIQKIITRFICLAAGTIESTRIALTGLINAKKFKIEFKNNQALIIPSLSKRMSIQKPKKSSYPAIPELQWHSFKSPADSSSGYILTAQFICDLIKKSVPRKLYPSSLEYIMHNIIFITAYLSADSSTATLNYRKDGSNIQDTYLSSVNDMDSHLANKKRLIRHINHLSMQLDRNLLIHPSINKMVANGGDVHYASTFKLDSKYDNYPLHVDKFGEVKELNGVFICDPSKLQFLSSLPHTFTAMALTELSMPKIISEAYA